MIHLEEEIFILAILSLWGFKNVDRIFREKRKRELQWCQPKSEIKVPHKDLGWPLQRVFFSQVWPPRAVLLADYPVHRELRRMLNQTGRARLRKQRGKGPVWQPVWKDNCQSCMQWGEHSHRFASTLCEELCNVEGSQRHGLIHPLLAWSSPEDRPGGWKRTAQQGHVVKTTWWSKQKQRTSGFISVPKIFTFSIL